MYQVSASYPNGGLEIRRYTMMAHSEEFIRTAHADGATIVVSIVPDDDVLAHLGEPDVPDPSPTLPQN